MAVRRESVILDLQTNVPRVAAEAAAAIALLRREVDGLDKGSGSSSRATKTLGNDIESTGRSAEKGASSIDKYSGRVGLLAKISASLGPGLVPIGAVGIPAVTGLASAFGFAAIGAGTAIGAFQGVGAALKALDKARIQPTTENLNAAKLAMEQISPAAQEFTRHIQQLLPELKALRDTGAANMFPGLTEGIDSLQTRLPVLQRIVAAVSGELGSIGAESGASLASPRWTEFFTFVEHEAPQALADLAHGLGSLTHAMAELWMATAPLNRGFSQWMVDSTAELDKWATGLSKTQGFADFVDYIQTTGPQVASTIGSISHALLQIVEAAAPVGGPVLKIVGALADGLAKIADSDLGTPIFATVAALSALNLAMSAGRGAVGKFTSAQTSILGGLNKQRASLTALRAEWAAYNRVSAFQSGGTYHRGAGDLANAEKFKGTLRETAATAGKSAAALAGLALATSGVADKTGLANTASLALMGTMAGPYGAAIGAAVGATIDLAHAGDDAEATITRLNQAMRTGDVEQLTKGIAEAKKQIDDWKHSTSVGDWLGDSFTAAGLAAKAAFTGKDTVGDLGRTLNAAQVAKDSAKSAAALRLMGHGFTLTAAGAQRAGESLSQFTAETQQMEAALSQRAGLRDFQAALDDMRKSLHDNGRTLDITTAKGRANQASLDQIASSALKVAQGMRVGSARQAVFLDKARGGFIKAAVAAGMGRVAAGKLADRLISVDRLKVNPKIKVDTAGAMSQVRSLRALILDATKPRTASITIKKHVTSLGGLLGVPNSADGSTVPKTGRPYADRHLYLLADGEEVISNRYGQADRHRDLLKAINGNMLANGGTTGYARMGGQRGELGGLTDELRKLRATIAKDTARRDALASKRSDLASTVSGQFMSDPFAGGNVWAKGGGDPKAILKADIAKAKAFRIVLGKLHKAGLDGPALAAVAATGDIGKAQALLATGKANIHTYESLTNRQAAAANAVGKYAGQAAYGAAIAQQAEALKHANAELKHLNSQIAQLRKENGHHAKATGQHVGRAINSAASKGHRHKRGA